MISNIHPAALVAVTLGWAIMLGGVAPGQDSARGPCGFIRMLDAVSVGTGKLEFLIDGKAVRADGYQLGNVTGGIAVQPGTHKIVFRREGVREGETQARVAANDTTILIPYAELVPATDAHPAVWEIRVLRLKQHESEDRRTASFVSVSRQPELKLEMRQPDGKWEVIFVKRLSIARADIKQARGYMAVRCNDEKLDPVSVAAAGNFVSVLYEDDKGTLRSKNFQDYKYLSAD